MNPDIKWLIGKATEYMRALEQQYKMDCFLFASHRFEHLQAQVVDYLIALEEELRKGDEDTDQGDDDE